MSKMVICMASIPRIARDPFSVSKKEKAEVTIYKIGNQDTHDYEDGGILYNVPCDQRVWDVVKIDCKSMEEVLQDSYIVNIS